MARCLGLTCIGWIFTDLLTEDMQKGTVRILKLYLLNNVNTLFYMIR